MPPLLIYIHGFQSSPLSQKAEETRHYLAKAAPSIEFVAPGLPCYPGEACRKLQHLISSQPQNRKMGMIGSSLGGFMATVLSEEFNIPAVLINPAVHPHRLISHYLGENINPYTQERFVLTQLHLQELEIMEPRSLRYPDNLWLLVQTGDETLDYRDAVAYYSKCRQTIEEGGNHRFEGFDRHLPGIMEFLFDSRHNH